MRRFGSQKNITKFKFSDLSSFLINFNFNWSKFNYFSCIQIDFPNKLFHSIHIYEYMRIFIDHLFLKVNTKIWVIDHGRVTSFYETRNDWYIHLWSTLIWYPSYLGRVRKWVGEEKFPSDIDWWKQTHWKVSLYFKPKLKTNPFLP